MADDVVGSVSVKIVPDASSFNRDTQRALDPQAQQLGQQLSSIIGQQISRGIAQSVQDGMRNVPAAQAARAGQDSGDRFSRAFSDEVKTRIRAALDNLPLANVGIDATEADQELGRLRMELHSLSANVGVGMDDSDALARLDLLRVRIDELSTSHPDITVGADTAGASAALSEVIAHADELGVHHPTVTVDVDSSHAEEQLAAVGAEADALAHERPTITVDADTAGADASIAATGAAAAEAGGSGGVGGLIAAAIGLSPVLVAVGAVGVGAFAAIGAAAAAVGAAMGVALLALKPVIDAYQAINAQKSAGKSSGASAAAQASAIQSANQQVAQSELALQNTRENVAAAAVAADQKIADSKQNLKDVERSTAEQIKNAEQSLAQARQAAAQQDVAAQAGIVQARQQAAQSQQSALQGVTSAQQSLAAAQQQALTAQQNLTQAREAEVQTLMQLKFAATDAALSERGAKLSVQQAQLNLAQTNANPKSTALQKAEAQLALDQAKQALIEQTVATKNAAKANQDAQKAGVEGSAAVVAAKQAEAQANQNVLNQQKALVKAQQAVTTAEVSGAQAIAKAQQAASQAQVNGARAIASAQQKLDDARYNGARSVQKAQQGVSQAQLADQQQSRQGAFQVEQATHAVTTAQQALAKAHQSTGAAGSAAATKTAAALAKLTPAGRSFLDFIMSAKSGFQGLSDKAQNGFLPGLEKGLKALSPLMKPLGGLVSGVAKAMGGIAESAGKAIGGPDGQKFVNFLSKNLPTWLKDAAAIAGGFMKGLAALFEGFGPTATLFLGWFANMSKAFGDWASKVTKTQGFKDFMAYIAKEAPVIGGIFKDLGVIVGKVVIALAPLGAKMAGALKSVTGFLAGLSPKTLGLIATAIIGIVVAMKAWALGVKVVSAATKIWTVVQTAFNIVMSLNPITLVIIALVALGVAVVVMYKKVGWFRDFVNLCWKDIKAAFHDTIGWIVNTAWPWLKGAFDDIVNGFKSVGHWFSQTWSNIEGYFTSAVNWVKGAWHTSWNAVTGVVTGAFNSARNGIYNTWQRIKGYFNDAVNWVKGTFKTAWAGIQEIFTHPLTAAQNVINNILGALGLQKVFTSMHDWVSGFFRKEWNGLQEIFTHPIQAAKNSINTILGALGLQKVFKDAVSEIGKIWGGIEKKFSGPLDAVKRIINDFIKAFNSVGKLVGLKIPLLSTGGSVPVAHGGGHTAPLRGYAGGGTVIQGPWRGPRADNVLGISDSGFPTARVNPGERITNVASTRSMDRKYPGLMDHINRHGDLPRFADGGLAPIIKTVAYALNQVGKPYVWGAAGPNAFDCSGLTSAAWEHGAGVHLTHLAAAQHNEGFGPISRSNLFPGDLVFPTVTAGGGIPHVEMYVGNGQVVEAMNPALGIRGPHPMNGFAGGARRPALFASATASNSSSIMDSLGNALAAAAKKGGSLLSGAAGAIFDPLKNWIGSHLGGLKKFAGPFAGKFLPGAAKDLASHALSTGISKAESLFNIGGSGSSSGNGGHGVARWAETIANALSMNHLPTNSSYVNAWLRQVSTESGGNPGAVQNGYSDINSMHGDLAKGLLQVISSTFRGYEFPGHGDIFNPLDNALAAIHYAKVRYGASGMLDVVGHGHGYAGGTDSARRGMAMVGEFGPELVNFRGGEQVYNRSQTLQLARSMRNASSAPVGPITLSQTSIDAVAEAVMNGSYAGTFHGAAQHEFDLATAGQVKDRATARSGGVSA